MARVPLDLDDLIERIEKLAAKRGCAVSDLKLLDVGAGSGNYFQGLRARGCNVQYHGLEGSQGMMDQFSAKANALDESTRGQFTLQQCDLKALPLDLDTASFDIVTITQVLHHLSTGDDGYLPVYDLMRELGRVTKPGGGFLWCSTQTQKQHGEDGFWWSAITPEASAKLAARFPPMDDYIASLLNKNTGANYSCVNMHIPTDPLMREEMYLDIEGAFKEEWRNCDSNWAICSEEELESGLTKLRSIIDSGNAEAFMAEREAARAGTGQTTTVVAVKH